VQEYGQFVASQGNFCLYNPEQMHINVINYQSQMQG
jgi:hypothetical protein